MSPTPDLDPTPGGAALRLTDDPLYTERRYPVAYVDPETQRERAGGSKTIYYAQRRLYEYAGHAYTAARRAQDFPPVPAQAEALLTAGPCSAAEQRRAAQLAWAARDRLARQRARGTAA